jgi:hypothetical protein
MIPSLAPNKSPGMPEYPEIKSLIAALIDPQTKMVRFKALSEVHDFLKGRKFRLIEKESYGPPGGSMLFYLV